MDGVFKVSKKSEVKPLSVAISKTFIEEGSLTVQAIGELANNQAIKGIARAIGLLESKGKRVLIHPFFGDTPHNKKDGTEATVICYNLVEVE
jgi:stage V sporulation protein SpoVS